MRRNKKQGEKYWTEATDAAIVAYNQESDECKRNMIYADTIYPALMKLAENVLFTFRFQYFDCDKNDVIMDAVCYMTARLDRFDPNTASEKYEDKKSTGYSYFTIVCKNYLMTENNKNWKKWKTVQTINVDSSHVHDMIDAEIVKVNEEIVMNNTDDVEFMDGQVDDFYDIYEWSKTTNSISSRDRKLLDRVKNVLEGKYKWVPRPNSEIVPMIWDTVTEGITRRYYGKSCFQRIIKKYNRERLGQKVNAVHIDNKKDEQWYERKCPLCGDMMYYMGKNAIYNVYYAEKAKRPCQSCSRKINLGLAVKTERGVQQEASTEQQPEPCLP